MRTRPSEILRRSLATGVLLATPLLALAKPPAVEPDNLINDTLTLQAGLIGSMNHTEIRRDASAGTPGTVVNGEQDLGLPSRKLTGLGELTLRMHKRHRIRLNDYFLPLDRSGTSVLSKTIYYGNTTYAMNEAVSTSVDLRVFGITYDYSIVHNDAVDLGLSIGANELDFHSQVFVPVLLQQSNYDRSAGAPLAGIDGTVRISSRFYAEARLQSVKANVGSIHGSLVNYQGNVLYRLSPNVTFGLGYAGFKINLDVTTVGDSGHVGFESVGPQTFVRVGF